MARDALGDRDRPDFTGVEFEPTEPVHDLYADGDPPVILIPCPTCKVEEGSYCVSPITGNERKIPCAQRLKLAGI